MSEPKYSNDSEQEMHEVMEEENDKIVGGAGAEENLSTTEEKEVHAEDNQFDKTLAKMDEKKPKLGKGELENGNKLVDAEEKEVHPERNQVYDTALIDEGSGEDPAQSPDFDPFLEGDDDGTEEEQAAFMRELENFHKEMRLDFKPPKFYGEGLNCLKLWRAVTRLGGYDQVTSCKLWRQVGESFKPPKTCTTIAWSFRCYYEHALLEYEKHKISTGKFRVPLSSLPKPMPVDNQDKTSVPLLKQDKYHKSIGTLKRKKASSLEHAVKASHKKAFKPQLRSFSYCIQALRIFCELTILFALTKAKSTKPYVG